MGERQFCPALHENQRRYGTPPESQRKERSRRQSGEIRGGRNRHRMGRGPAGGQRKRPGLHGGHPRARHRRDHHRRGHLPA